MSRGLPAGGGTTDLSVAVKDDEPDIEDDELPAETVLGAAQTLPSPMNGLGAGTAFGTVVHEILEVVDTSALDLEVEVRAKTSQVVAAMAVTSGVLWALSGAFGAVGMAFMFVEMAFIQKFTLFLSHPLYAVAVVLFRTRFGFDPRAVGLQPDAAESAGIRVPRVWVWSMTLAGALAGLGGSNFVLGYKHYFELGFSGGAGFIGIAVALLGRNHPTGVIVASLFFGALSYGALVVNTRVPRELVEVLMALVILFAICTRPLLERAARRWA